MTVEKKAQELHPADLHDLFTYIKRTSTDNSLDWKLAVQTLNRLGHDIKGTRELKRIARKDEALRYAWMNDETGSELTLVDSIKKNGAALSKDQVSLISEEEVKFLFVKGMRESKFTPEQIKSTLSNADFIKLGGQIVQDSTTGTLYKQLFDLRERADWIKEKYLDNEFEYEWEEGMPSLIQVRLMWQKMWIEISAQIKSIAEGINSQTKTRMEMERENLQGEAGGNPAKPKKNRLVRYKEPENVTPVQVE